MITYDNGWFICICMYLCMDLYEFGVSGLIFWCLDLYLGCLDLYSGCLGLYPLTLRVVAVGPILS